MVLGSDLGSVVLRGGPGRACPEGLRNSFDLSAFFSALEAQGVPRGSLATGGERVLSVLERVEALADPRAREAAKARRIAPTSPFAGPY